MNLKDLYSNDILPLEELVIKKTYLNNITNNKIFLNIFLSIYVIMKDEKKKRCLPHMIIESNYLKDMNQ